MAVAIAGGAVAVTGLFLTGRIKAATVPVYADFSNCGQGLRVGGDVKLRGVLVGRIGQLINTPEIPCRIRMDIIPSTLDEIPANAGAQIRAKTIFGEKWVELLYPEDAVPQHIAADDTIDQDRTIEPLEVETILNVALPLLDAIQPDRLAGALDALAEGFVGQEDEVITAIEQGIEALRPLNKNRDLLIEGLTQLKESGEVLDEVDDDLLIALANLDNLNRFTIDNQELLADSLEKAPKLFVELSRLFRTRLLDFTELVNEGATVIGLVAGQAGDVERILQALPRFNHAWIRNLSAACPVRIMSTEPGLAKGDPVPGRCWRVHNILSESQGAYEPGDEPRPGAVSQLDYLLAGLNVTSAVDRILMAPSLAPEGSR